MIRLLIADDQAVVRAGLSVILGAEPDIEVVGEAIDGADAVRLAKELRPDLICMDIRMPGTDGIAATRTITTDPELDADVLILTTFDVDADVFAALEAGAAGFLLKGADEATLLAAIRSVAAGEGTLDQRLTRRILREFSERRSTTVPATTAPAESPLTDREFDVLHLLAEGLSNAEIADRLFVEPTTVKYHLAGLLQKTGARDRLQAVLWGIRAGLVDPR
ncbi:two-component system response regulator [Plantibacter sp. Leaf171]|uniref:response regulator n=1 Tax=unclassified Plantibacter TaxID=2624265 RepID=UPI0006FD0B4C|nr:MULTISPECIES: response regulator transcription factor [unclassified Plantibacter]KQM16385.1 two-component system response regulator [Plantibacter sp. Leaf1]KQR59518.1 two-component system response regulator [Plantibacter sp. Leaf171]